MQKTAFYNDPQQCCTEHYYQHSIQSDFLYTDGVKSMAEKLQAFWTIDVVASHFQGIVKFWKKGGLRAFAVITFILDGSGGCRFEARDDIPGKLAASQDIEYTDLKENVKMFLIDNVLIMPSEY